MLIYAGVKLLFRIRYSNRWLNLSLGILWVLGLLIGFYVMVGTVKQFSQESRIKETTMIHGLGDTVIIKLNPGLAKIKAMNLVNADDLENYLSRHHSDYYFGETGRTSTSWDTPA